MSYSKISTYAPMILTIVALVIGGIVTYYTALADTRERIDKVRIDVAEKYVIKEDLKRIELRFDRVERKIDRILLKLNR